MNSGVEKVIVHDHHAYRFFEFWIEKNRAIVPIIGRRITVWIRTARVKIFHKTSYWNIIIVITRYTESTTYWGEKEKKNGERKITRQRTNFCLFRKEARKLKRNKNVDGCNNRYTTVQKFLVQMKSHWNVSYCCSKVTKIDFDYCFTRSINVYELLLRYFTSVWIVVATRLYCVATSSNASRSK